VLAGLRLVRGVECRFTASQNGLNVQILGASEEAPMRVREGLTKTSEPDKVDAYMNNLKNPLAAVAKAQREVHSRGHLADRAISATT
jgi:hypothetical protein